MIQQLLLLQIADCYPRKQEVVDQPLPAHRHVLKRIVPHACEVVVHQPRNRPFTVPLPPHEKVRGALRITPSDRLIEDWRSFWNAGDWRRGAISMKTPIDAIDWEGLFEFSQLGGWRMTDHQLKKGNPPAALTYAIRHAQNGHAVHTLRASNGIQYLNVWLPDEDFVEKLQQAQQQCGCMVTSDRAGRGLEREIVVDRPPYAIAGEWFFK